MTASVMPDDATNKEVTWKSSKPAVATVSATGLVEAKTAGDTVITATSQDGGKEDICNVTVTDPTIYVTGVSVEPKTLSLKPGETSDLTVTITPTDATNKQVEWSSDKSAIVSVSAEGKVEAKAAGDAVITVKTKDGGKTATCTITVTAAKAYAVGDAYPDADNPVGVVFWVSPDDNTIGKAISLTEFQGAWGLEQTWIETGAQDMDNGPKNTTTIKAIENWEDNYPAFKWCADLGEKWYIPATNEWLIIYNKKTEINRTFRALGKPELQTQNYMCYWSSTEHPKDPSDPEMSKTSANCIYLSNQDVYSYHKYYEENFVRAAIAF